MHKILLGLTLLPLGALAQSAPPPVPTTPTDPAVQTTLVDDRGQDAPLPEKILDPAPPEAEMAVSIRTDGRTGDIVEEYRQNGRIYLVKVRPEHGVPYALMDTNGDGRLDESDGDGPVRPVYYTLYEWD